MTLQELLTIYDSPDKKGFYSHELTGDLKNLPEDERQKPECAYEGIIHSLQIHPEGCHWGTYLGYLASGIGANGEPVEFPSKEDVTNEVVTYSEKRMRQTTNPRMQMQYAAVCWDFMPLLDIAKPADLHSLYVNALIATINGDFEPHPVMTAKHIRRAFAVCGKSPAIITSLKTSMREFTKRNGGNDTSAGIWGVEFDIMTTNKKLFTPEEQALLVAEHEARLSRLTADESQLDPFAIQEQVSLLADYYKPDATAEHKIRVLRALEDSIRKSENGKPALHRMGMMQMMHNIYNNYNLPNEAKRLLPEIQKISEEAPSEMQATQFEYTQSQEELDRIQAFIDDHSVGTDDEKLVKYIYNHIEKKDHVTEQVEQSAVQAPLLAMTQTQMMDEKGRPMSVLRSVEEDLEGHLAYTATQNMLFTAHILHQITQNHINNGFFTSAYLMDEVKKSAVVDASRYDIIAHALTFFFSEDYITFCHLIVPQIEDALRNIVEQSGNAVIKRQRSGFGFQLKTLDEILLDPSIQQALTDDGAFHLRVLLTDQKGFNIRNLLCHGISNPACFNVVAAERLLHALLLLANLRVKP